MRCHEVLFRLRILSHETGFELVTASLKAGTTLEDLFYFQPSYILHSVRALYPLYDFKSTIKYTEKCFANSI